MADWISVHFEIIATVLYCMPGVVLSASHVILPTAL